MPTLDLLTRPSFSTRHLVAAGALTALLVGAAAPARAHEFWLWPDRFAAAAGETLNVRALVGTGFRGELKPYAAPRVKRLELRTNRVTDLRGIPLNGGDEYARFITPDAAGGLLTYESDFATITLPGVDFDRYLALEGLDDARATHAKAGLAVPGRERYARCCRTWIAGGTAAATGIRPPWFAPRGA